MSAAAAAELSKSGNWADDANAMTFQPEIHSAPPNFIEALCRIYAASRRKHAGRRPFDEPMFVSNVYFDLVRRHIMRIYRVRCI